MTPGARVQAAIAVLDTWRGGAPVERALTNWGRGARYAGSRDRAAVRDHVYDVLRARGSCAALGGGESGRALMIGLLRLQGVDPATRFTGEGYAPTALDAAEAALPQAADDAGRDVPDWTLPMLQARAGRDLPAMLAALRMRAPVYLRTNTILATPAEAIALLSEDGIAAEADAELGTALIVRDGARRIAQSAAYRDGRVELQDLSVQRAVATVDWPEGRILDYCAGGGGKALAISAAVQATVYAHDADPRRMADLPLRATRAGIHIERLAESDLGAAGPFDAVLCDVPCSGSGTWRRDPEAKWRLTQARLAEYVAEQAMILGEAAALTAPGGSLVYMTCSLFKAENEDQVDRFLADRPGWRCVASGMDTPLSASDGFFHAVLVAPPDI